MKEQLIKAQKRNQLVDMIYISKTNQITQRRIRVIKIDHDTFKAYCFTKHSIRTFIIDNVLSLFPVVMSERDVI